MNHYQQLTDSQNEPVAIIKTIEVTIMPLNEIIKGLAIAEGDLIPIVAIINNDFTKSSRFIKHEKTQVKRLVFLVAWRRPTLTGTRSQLPSALESLTSVFGMGTGVTSLPSSPNYWKAYSFKTR